MERIQQGYTNKSFRDGKFFYQEKNYTGFNHHLDYSLLTQFSFVPRLIANQREFSKWEYIDGSVPEMSEQNLKQIAQHLNTLHLSKLKFPANNLVARINHYLAIIKQKHLPRADLPHIFQLKTQIFDFLAQNQNIWPLHNDLWPINLVEDSHHQIYFVDWEYATMGDIHFELAYFIEASKLNLQQETFLLTHFDSINQQRLIQNKIIVNYLVVLWALAQIQLPFEIEQYLKKIDKLNELL
ncbi:phosphotransferase family protein [Mycoplasmopsis columbinasalis]|uniref:Aminoglycoside phosphotransferase domain-containing protein n=1 Tax=Mycoplasmopsis columbinasalis TaxID=114880 RepID=A0A449BAZ2_9BACT|nr:phosphotransferase [Mycoplasmopsis columbinasalis]VEU78367.1 Uncharacterised protein [Mycoplasmopsis columbinasalis]